MRILGKGKGQTHLARAGQGVGGGLVFAAVSNTCMMGNLLGKLPYNRGPACDIDQALTRLGAR